MALGYYVKLLAEQAACTHSIDLIVDRYRRLVKLSQTDLLEIKGRICPNTATDTYHGLLKDDEAIKIRLSSSKLTVLFNRIAGESYYLPTNLHML